MQTNLYLFFPGNCLEAMRHYAEILGGEITGIMRNSDAAPEDRMPGGDDMVMNLEMKLGGLSIFASDNSSDMYQVPQGFRIQLEMASVAEFDRAHEALSADAHSVEMPTGETFWAEKFAMFTDRFGTPWMLNYTGNKMGG